MGSRCPTAAVRRSERRSDVRLRGPHQAVARADGIRGPAGTRTSLRAPRQQRRYDPCPGTAHADGVPWPGDATAAPRATGAHRGSHDCAAPRRALPRPGARSWTCTHARAAHRRGPGRLACRMRAHTGATGDRPANDEVFHSVRARVRHRPSPAAATSPHARHSHPAAHPRPKAWCACAARRRPLGPSAAHATTPRRAWNGPPHARPLHRTRVLSPSHACAWPHLYVAPRHQTGSRPEPTVPGPRTQQGYAPAGAHDGSVSVRSSHACGGAPAFPAASTPPTMAQFVSTSPPAWAVAQKASS